MGSWWIWFTRRCGPILSKVDAVMKPSWKIRRRYIFAAFVLGATMLMAGATAVLLNNDSATSDLITGGVALITLILSSYIFGAVWEDKSNKMEDIDG